MHAEQKAKPTSRLERAVGYRERKEQLKQTKRLGMLLEQAERYAFDIFPDFAQEVPGLDKDDPKLRGVLLLGDYQGVEQTSPEYGTLLRAKSLRQKLAREVVRDVITSPDATVEISSEQRILLKYGLQMQDIVDDLHIKWYEELIQGPKASQIKAFMENDANLNLLLGEHGDFLYGFGRKEGQGVQFHTYADAYPQEIAAISSYIDGMIAELTPLAEAGSDEAKAHIAVHRQWQKLITFTGSAQEQEALGHELDEVWMKDANANNPAIRSQVLYPMEAYTSGKSVEWQYDLLLKQPEFNALNAACDQTKQVMKDVFQHDPDFAKLPTLQKSLRILDTTDSTVYLRFIGGTPLGFRSAASNVPNRNDVRLEYGSKINFDYTTFEQRAQIATGLVQNVFGQEMAQEIFGDLPTHIPLLLGRFVAGHEDAHNILEREDTYRMMGMQNHIDLDEAKADLASFVVCLTPGFLDTRTQTDLMKVLFAEELRGLKRWDEQDTDRSHLNGNIILVQLMLDHGILQKSPQRWSFDSSNPTKLQAVRASAKEALLNLATVYEATDADTARANGDIFKNRYINTPSRELLELIHDAGIISHEKYREEIHKYYPEDFSDRRTTTAVLTGESANLL